MNHIVSAVAAAAPALLARYWIAGVLFSIAFTAWSVVWTIRANMRFRRLERELEVQHKAWLAMVGKFDQIEGYLEKTPTGHMKKAPLLRILYGGRDSSAPPSSEPHGTPSLVPSNFPATGEP